MEAAAQCLAGHAVDVVVAAGSGPGCRTGLAVDEVGDAAGRCNVGFGNSWPESLVRVRARSSVIRRYC